jgi:hypothetical protein
MHFKTGRKASSSDDYERITGYAHLTLLRVAHELAPGVTRREWSASMSWGLSADIGCGVRLSGHSDNHHRQFNAPYAG